MSELSTYLAGKKQMRARLQDAEKLARNAKSEVDEMKADLLWCVMLLAKITKEDPPSAAT